MNLRLGKSKIVLLIAVVFSIIVCIFLMPFNASANNDYSNELDLPNTDTSISFQNDFTSIFTFTPISETECDVRLADKTATQAIIPEKVDINGKEYTVTVIAANAFTSATKLEMVRLPKSVKTIGSNAFINCKALTSLTLNAVETIGANAFAMTKMDYLIIPTTVTSVASTILRGANTQVYVRSALEEGATVPEGWVSNWNGNNKNQSVEFDSSFVPDVKYEFVSSEVATFALGDDVDLRNGGYYVTGFQEFCTIDTDEYKEVYIPATYTGEDGIEYPIIGIDSFAFLYNVIDKVTIGYAEEPIKLASESFYGLEGSVITFNRKVVLENEDYDGNLVISESVFADVNVLTIILPNTIETIGNNMFDGCENLRDIHFIEPDGTLSQLAETNIGIRLISTQKVELPNTVMFIGDNAFNLTRNILDLYIPSSVEFVGSNIISGWKSNQTVYVDLVADDPILENWNEYWALGSGQDDTANVVYRLSDTSYQITYDVGKEYHNNADSYISSEGLALLPVEMTGYTFEGWYLDENFTKPIENIAIGTTGNLTLYAKLVGNQYTIKYDRNQPAEANNPVAGDMEQSTHYYGTTSKISENQFTLKGWTFKEWNTQADGKGTTYNLDAEVTTAITSGKLTLYAQWSQNSYKLTYVGNCPNAASSAISSDKDITETYEYEEEFNIKGVIYSVKGWTFTGWNTEKDGSGDPYVMGSKKQSLTEGGELILYGQWTVNTYIIEFDSNGGSGSLSFKKLTYEEGYKIPENPFTYVGRHFVGWKDGSGNSYKEGDSISKLTEEDNGKITLYAQWEMNTYTIEFIANNGTEDKVIKNLKYEEGYKIPDNPFTYIGKHFTGWKDGSGNSYQVGKIYSKLTEEDNVKITIYAQWATNKYTIQYIATNPSSINSITGDKMDEQPHDVGTPKQLSMNTCSVTGWTFIGWYSINSDGTQRTYDPNEIVSNLTTEENGIVKLYTRWRRNHYTINYNLNLPTPNSGVTNAETLPESTTHYYETPSPIIGFYTLVSWEMDGWYYNDTKYEAGENVSTLCSTDGGTITLVARWKAKENVLDCINSSGIYEIVNANQLKGISQGASNDTFILMCDLDIQSNWDSLSEFNGILDLGGHTISYQHNSIDSNTNYGFILNNKGTIKNGCFKPYLKQSSVTSSQQNELYIGGVVAENNGTITNVEVLSYLGEDNYMTSDDTKTDINAWVNNYVIGGIAGLNAGTISSCKNNASLGGSYYIGGIAGKNMENAKIESCTNEGRIWYCSIGGSNRCVGGLVGAIYSDSKISSSNSNALITFAYRKEYSSNDLVYMARLVGWKHTSATVENCNGLSNPIVIVNENGLSNLQLSFIKNVLDANPNPKKFRLEFEDFGKKSLSPESTHTHSYLGAKISSISHERICSCGSYIIDSHKIYCSDAGKQKVNCIECNSLLDMSVDVAMIVPDNYGKQSNIVSLSAENYKQATSIERDEDDLKA